MAASFAQILKEIIEDPNISAIEYRLYSLLMSYGFERGYSQAGQDFLAKKLNIHIKTVAKSLKRLEELEYITVTKLGHNRNDEIRCKKTVKWDKEEAQKQENTKPTRSKWREPKQPARTGNKMATPYNIIDRKKINRDIEAVPPSHLTSGSFGTEKEKLHQETICVDSKATTDLHRALQENMLEKSYNTWLKDAQVLENGEVKLNGSIVCYDWVDKHYREKIEALMEREVVFLL